jgi:hypothetical protein
MGYESTLLVCTADNTGRTDRDGYRWADVRATIELGTGVTIPTLPLGADRWHVYSWTGSETMITEDRYGQPLLPVDLDEAVAALGEPTFRGAALGLATLSALQLQRRHWPDLLILHYGH